MEFNNFIDIILESFDSDSVSMNYATLPNRGYPKVKAIVDTLSKKELDRICHGGVFKDSPFIVYRNIIDDSFIDIYSIKNKSIGSIVLVSGKKSRGKGNAQLLIDIAIKDVKLLGIRTLEWKTQKSNLASIHLAEKFKFKFIEEDGESVIYNKKI